MMETIQNIFLKDSNCYFFNLLAIHASIEYFPGPETINSKNIIRYTKANSPTAIDPPCVTKNAMNIVNAIGIKAKRVKKPIMTAIEQTNSPKMARLNDNSLPK